MTIAPQTTPAPNATAESNATPLFQASPAALLANTVLAITVLALAIRLIDLGGVSLWFDELLEYERATGTWRETLLGRGIDQDPPLFALFNRIWFALIPVHSEFWLRLPSAVAGSAAVWLVGRWSGSRFGSAVGILSAFFMAIAPVHVHYSRELNQYVWMTLLTIAAIVLWERVRVSWKGRDWAAFGVVSAIAILTHYGLAFPLAAMVVDLVLVYRRRRRSNSEINRSATTAPASSIPTTATPLRPLLIYALALGILVTTLLALGLADRLDTGHVQKRWGGTHLEKELDYILDTGWREVLVFFFLPFAGGAALPIVRALSLLSLAGIVDLWQRKPAGKRTFGGILGGTLCLTYVASVFGLYPLGFRHGLFNAPLLLVALAGGVVWAGRMVYLATARLAVTDRHPEIARHTVIDRRTDIYRRTDIDRRAGIATTTTQATLTVLIAAAFIAFSPHEWWDNPHLTVPREHGREIAALLASTTAAGDAIYVYHAAAPAFRFYGIGEGSAVDLGDRASIIWGRPFDSRNAVDVADEAARIEAAALDSPTGHVRIYYVHVNPAERSALRVALDAGPLSPERIENASGGNALIEVWRRDAR